MAAGHQVAQAAGVQLPSHPAGRRRYLRTSSLHDILRGSLAGNPPDHLSAPPRLGPLFALDGAAFVLLALASLRYSWWRGPAATLLVLTIGAYLVVISRALETVDDLGVATKLVEKLRFEARVI